MFSYFLIQHVRKSLNPVKKMYHKDSKDFIAWEKSHYFLVFKGDIFSVAYMMYYLKTWRSGFVFATNYNISISVCIEWSAFTRSSMKGFIHNFFLLKLLSRFQFKPELNEKHFTKMHFRCICLLHTQGIVNCSNQRLLHIFFQKWKIILNYL